MTESVHRHPIDQAAVDRAAARIDAGLRALRDDIHRHPELAGAERRTAATVARALTEAGLDVTTGVGGHGVVGVLKGARPGRTVAYRADMDAVASGEQFPGGGATAHVCGHDVHTTVGVGVAKVLASLRERLRGKIVFFFQPAEETLEGARAMLAARVLERYAPAEIHALHCGPMPVGGIAITPGSGLPGLDRGTVTLTGPDAAERAGRLAAELAGLSTVTPPESPADLERLVADIQTPDGPLARFVWLNARAGEPGADGRVDVGVFYRCWPEERHAEVRAEVARLAAPYGDPAVVFPEEPFPALVCAEREARALERHVLAALGPDTVSVAHAAMPFNGEDFALFADRLPGTYSYLGVRRPGAGIETSSPHRAAFDPDPRAIGVGVRAMAGWLAARAA
ncbi:M20 metallopeptidase family protein [Phytomonospora endophytica]|uniref:Metal-dependent amidase/aminoacylase/carboxypeptidase family protein n=1 Tax=Phytomonospora endophytica TaxID=714109 RepID=A0A841F8L0_9ACTN|nr:M20/M25/M40 family metallo-hydrolase [Phytomonospora endophytica]MBB6033431.1 metal-dependent amidase/aminoacylase/carboxypeptidase family protein [Phytomonospora endophytica]GIG70796.1 N-acyl-L-amino acid amidohydrolase [Phytomonospora endophytica]